MNSDNLFLHHCLFARAEAGCGSRWQRITLVTSAIRHRSWGRIRWVLHLCMCKLSDHAALEANVSLAECSALSAAADARHASLG